MSLVTALEAPLSISNAIRKAARATGADFTYLLKTAARESSFNKSAKARTSSAAGLFQFIEGTWLRMVKEAGDKFGLGKYTPHIFTTRSGKYYVPNQELRQEILQLRHNPEVSAMMAGAFTQENSEFVASQLGREPSKGELYIAHFLGPKGAADLITLADKRPNARADRHFPRAARANHSIFYSRGRPRSLSQVYEVLVGHHAKLKAIASNPAPVAPDTPSAPDTGQARISKPVAAPIKSSTPVTSASRDSQSPALLHKASLTSKPDAPFAAPALPGAEVETKVVDASPSPEAVGLLGQKASPAAQPVKVAALTHNNLNIAEKTKSDTVSGSIGVWTTIVEPPKVQTNVRDGAVTVEPARDGENSANDRRSERKKQVSRSHRLLDQAQTRGARASAARRASATNSQIRNPWDREKFWERMTYNRG